MYQQNQNSLEKVTSVIQVLRSTLIAQNLTSSGSTITYSGPKYRIFSTLIQHTKWGRVGQVVSRRIISIGKVEVGGKKQMHVN